LGGCLRALQRLLLLVGWFDYVFIFLFFCLFGAQIEASVARDRWHAAHLAVG
jgi:hypothetical protein